ncbi:unnamed protein product [Thlaspi arvense]|uniref:BHLH domain-containing protein n=1 Tax=Thlaspi arvense TaxID=13288 RepID=A0AAU9T3A0_THLAR|nr:unnamed protein product [Thlaspi arvense]
MNSWGFVSRGEDDIVELLWKSGQIVESSQTQSPTTPPPPPLILRGSGSGGGGGEENAPVPHPPPLQIHQQPSDQNLFIREDEMASWLHHPLGGEDEFHSHLFYSGVVSATSTQPPQSSLSLGLPPLPPPPPPPTRAPYDLPAVRPTGQFISARTAENFMNFLRLRASLFTGGRVEAAAPWIPMSSATGSSLTPATEGTESRATVIGGVSHTFQVPSLSRKATDIAGPSSSAVTKTETEPIPIEPATETGTADERKRKEREETADEIQETEEPRGSTSRKRSRAAEMHNISERRRRERINEKMKALQELIPRCNKSDKASMLEDAIEYVKSLQMQIQACPQKHRLCTKNKMMSTGGGGMMPMICTPDMQRFMPHMAMGMMGMNRPPCIPFPGTAFPRPAHMAGPGPPFPAPPYPFPDSQALDSSRVQLPSQQPDPTTNQPQVPGYWNPYSQFVGLHQMQQQQPPPPLQNQATSQISFTQASSKEPDDQENQPKG